MQARSGDGMDMMPIGHLDRVLQQAVHQACLLEDALDKEMSALANRDVDALNDAVGHKHRVAQSLERLAGEQAALLRAGGFGPDSAGMDACLARWDAEGTVHRSWTRLQEAMERCRRLNQVNGHVVRLEQQQVVQAIRVLRGIDMQTELYDPRGRAVSDGSSRHLSKA